MPIKFSKHWHMAQHFTEGENLTTKAACHHYAGEFGGPVGNMTGSTECGGHESYNIAQ